MTELIGTDATKKNYCFVIIKRAESELHLLQAPEKYLPPVYQNVDNAYWVGYMNELMAWNERHEELLEFYANKELVD